MTKEELIKKLRNVDENTEEGHAEADNLLIEYINDKEIAEAYDAIHKWYA